MSTATWPQPYLKDVGDLSFSHMGFYVRDLERMGRFYREVLCFFETDRGDLGPVKLIFLSRNPEEHHQIVLASGRPTDLSFSVINQLSMKVRDVGILRQVRNHALADPDVTDMACVTHGNALSIYFRDPEGNRIEVFCDTPWYCEQPLREPVDLDKSDEEVLAQAEALARTRPRFQPRATWLAEMRRKMGAA